MRNLVVALVARFVDRLSQPARASARAIGDVERAQRMAQRAGAQWSRGMDELDGKLDRLAKVSLVTEGLDRAGQAMIRPLRAATASAAEFESGMTGIGITAQLTDRQLQPMRRTIIATASELGALPSVVQGAFASVMAEGVYKTEAELTRAGRAVARFQSLAATMRDPISSDEAGGLSAGLATSFNIAADRLERANAMLNRAAKEGGMGMGVQARFLPEQAGMMKGLGAGNERGLASLLAANQIAKGQAGSSEAGANNISNLLGQIASPEVLRNFAKIGINLEREIKRGVEAGISPLETVAAVTKRATGGDQFKIGKLFGDRQARSGVMALVDQLDSFREKTVEIASDRALSDYMADIERAAAGPAASFARYQSSMARAGIATGTILAPAVSVAADALGRLANRMSAGAESGNPLARAAVFITAGFAGLAVSAGAIGNVLMGVLGPMFIMKSMFGTLGGAVIKSFAANVVGGLARARVAVLAFNLTMLANPVVLAVAAAIAAVAVVAVVVRKYWQPIKAFFGGFAQGLGQAFAPLGAALAPLKPVWDGFVAMLGRAWSWVSRLLQPVQSTRGELTSAASAGQRFGQALGGAITFAMFPMRALMALGQAGWPILRRLFSFSPVGLIISNWGAIVGVASGIIARVQAVMSGGWRGMAARFVGFGAAIMQGLIRGILRGAAGVGRAISSAASGAVTSFKNRLGIRSPSRVFAGLGGDTMAGLVVGLRRTAPGAFAAIAAVGAGMASALPAVAGPASASGRGSASAAIEATAAAPIGAGGASTTGPAGIVIQKLEQHFHLPAGSPTNPRELARELARLSAAGQRRAMNDAELP